MDSLAFSSVADKVLYNEMEPSRASAARHNFPMLGAQDIVVTSHCVSAENDAVWAELKSFGPSLIYMDPARRSSSGSKVFLLEDCSPDVLTLTRRLFDLAPNLLIKLSPMADISMLVNRLRSSGAFTKEVHVVAHAGECKELLLVLDGKAAVELLGYAPAPELGSTLVYLSVENLSAKALAVGTSYLQSRDMTTTDQLYRLGTGLTAVCDGKAVRCGSFAAPLYGENAADASAFTLNLAAGRGAMLHCFCETPEDWTTLELTYQPDFASGQTMHFVVSREVDEVQLGAVPTTPAEVGSVVDL